MFYSKPTSTPRHGLVHQPPVTPNHVLYQPLFTPHHDLRQPPFTPNHDLISQPPFTPNHTLHQPPFTPNHVLHQTTVYTAPHQGLHQPPFISINILHPFGLSSFVWAGPRDMQILCCNVPKKKVFATTGKLYSITWHASSSGFWHASSIEPSRV